MSEHRLSEGRVIKLMTMKQDMQKVVNYLHTLSCIEDNYEYTGGPINPCRRFKGKCTSLFLTLNRPQHFTVKHSFLNIQLLAV